MDCQRKGSLARVAHCRQGVALAGAQSIHRGHVERAYRQQGDCRQQISPHCAPPPPPPPHTHTHTVRVAWFCRAQTCCQRPALSCGLAAAAGLPWPVPARPATSQTASRAPAPQCISGRGSWHRLHVLTWRRASTSRAAARAAAFISRGVVLPRLLTSSATRSPACKTRNGAGEGGSKATGRGGGGHL